MLPASAHRQLDVHTARTAAAVQDDNVRRRTDGHAEGRLHIDRQARIDRVRRLELTLDCVTRPSYESSTLRERSAARATVTGWLRRVMIRPVRELGSRATPSSMNNVRRS
jgi:hypothetical protein